VKYHFRSIKSRWKMIFDIFEYVAYVDFSGHHDQRLLIKGATHHALRGIAPRNPRLSSHPFRCELARGTRQRAPTLRSPISCLQFHGN
jgi:hypothetical protein